MKPILTSKPKAPNIVKWIAILVFLMIIVSAVLSIKYGNNKNNYVELKSDERLPMPQCKTVGGFHADAFAVSLNLDRSEGTIHYTLDGTEPTLASAIYKKPFIIHDRTSAPNYLSAIPTSPRWKQPVGDVFKGTVLRAIVISDDHRKSRELIRTFFVDAKGVNRYTLPVVALTVNPGDLFGYKNGIYVLGRNYEDKDYYIRKNIPLDLPWWQYPSNYLKRGSNSERPVHIEFYEPDGNLGFEINAGVRINGSATRGFSQKSLRICFNEKYGAQALNYKLFPGYPVTQFNSIILRNSGNDWNKTMFRDAFMQSLMSSANVDIQQDRAAVVFINGEYWGIHNIRERFDEYYIANKYKLPSDSISILESLGQLAAGAKKDERAFAELMLYVGKNNLSEIKNYNYLASKIDIESFMDLIIANIYFCNSDWPNNNVKFWKYQAKSNAGNYTSIDGRWRWMLYDTDWGFGYNSSSVPTINLLEKAASTGIVGTLFSSMLKNEKFVNSFLLRFQYHLNTTFYTPNVLRKIDQFQTILDPEIREHINRWRVINSYDEWLSNIDEMRDFAKKRPEFQAGQLNAFFQLKNNEQIVIQK